MLFFYLVTFTALVIVSAFFSSAETALLSLNKIKLKLKAKKRKKKAVLLSKILSNPDEFFSTILIGNNLVNIAAASISTLLFTKLITSDERLALVISTLVTTVIILLFAEVFPKSYAFRHNEKMSNLYAYPIEFFSYLFYPFVKILSALSNLLFKKSKSSMDKKEFTPEEVKHFLASEIKLFRYDPQSLRMINEIIDIAGKDIKSLMTPRLHIVAFKEGAHRADLKRIVLEGKFSKIPVYRDSLDNITGIIHTRSLTAALMSQDFGSIDLKRVARPPIFISEYSSLNYAVNEFKKKSLNMAVILDEYGATIGILTLNDIFREILGGIHIKEQPIRRLNDGIYVVKGAMSVEEVNAQLDLSLPEGKDYTTLSGLFLYFYGKFPQQPRVWVKVKGYQLVAHKIGRRKLDEIKLILAKE